VINSGAPHMVVMMRLIRDGANRAIDSDPNYTPSVRGAASWPPRRPHHGHPHSKRLQTQAFPSLGPAAPPVAAHSCWKWNGALGEMVCDGAQRAAWPTFPMGTTKAGSMYCL